MAQMSGLSGSLACRWLCHLVAGLLIVDMLHMHMRMHMQHLLGFENDLQDLVTMSI